MKKKIFYQICKSENKTQGCQNNNFTFPFFKKYGGHGAQRAYFNEEINAFVMNDKKRNVLENGIFYSFIPYDIISQHELISYNNSIACNTTKLFKLSRMISNIVSREKQIFIISKIEFIVGIIF